MTAVPQHPTVIIGLGNAGAEMARSYSGFVDGRNTLGLLTEVITIDATGFSRFGHEEDSVAFDGVQPDDSFKSWYDRVVDHEDRLTALIHEALRSVLGAETRLAVEGAGGLVDPQADIVLVAALSDPLGSSAIIPILGFLNYLYNGPMLGQYPSVEMLLLWPDLFAETMNDKRAFARSAAAIKELNRASRVPEEVFGSEFAFSSPVAWLISGANSDGVNVGMLSELMPMITRALASRRAGNMAMGSYLAGAGSDCGGSWGSFGLCEVTSDTDSALTAIGTGLIAEWASTRATRPGRLFQRAQVAVDVERFLRDSGAASPEDLLNRASDGTPLFQPFSFSGSAEAGRDPGQFQAELDLATSKYESSEWLKLQSDLAVQRGVALEAVTDQADALVAEALDDPSRSAEYAHAFTEVALGGESEFLEGEAFESPMNLGTVASQAMLYFEGAMGLASQRAAGEALAQDITATERQLAAKREQLSLMKAAAAAEAPVVTVVESTDVPTTKDAPEATDAEDAESAGTPTQDDEPVDEGEATESDLESKPADEPEVETAESVSGDEAELQDDSADEDEESTYSAAIELLEADVADLKQQLTEMRVRRKSVDAEITAAALAVASKPKRDDAREAALLERKAEYYELSQRLADVHVSMRAAEHEHERLLAAANAASRKFMVMALVLGGVTLLLCGLVYLVIFLNPLSWAFVQPLYFWIFIIGGYLTWVIGAFIRMSKVRGLADEAEAKLRALAAHKKQLMNGLYQHVVDTYAFRFQWALNSLVTDLVTDLQARLAERSQALRTFLGEIDELATRASERWSQFEFPVRVFSRPLMNRATLESALVAHDMGFKSERTRLIAGYGYSAAYRDMLASGSMDVVESRIQAHCEKEYAFVREFTVEALVSDLASRDTDALDTLVTQAIAASQPFLMLYNTGAQTRVAEHVYLGVKRGDESSLFARVASLGEAKLADFQRPQVFDSTDPQRATFYRFLLGLSLDQVSLWRFSLEQLEKAENPEELYAMLEAQDEQPTPCMVNRDELWEDLRLARVVGLLPVDVRVAFSFAGREYTRAAELENYFRSFGASARRRAFAAQVSEALLTAEDALTAAIEKDEQFDAAEIEFLRRKLDESLGMM